MEQHHPLTHHLHLSIILYFYFFSCYWWICMSANKYSVVFGLNWNAGGLSLSSLPQRFVWASDKLFLLGIKLSRTFVFAAFNWNVIKMPALTLQMLTSLVAPGPVATVQWRHGGAVYPPPQRVSCPSRSPQRGGSAAPHPEGPRGNSRERILGPSRVAHSHQRCSTWWVVLCQFSR